MLALQLKAAQRCASLIGDFKQLSADKIAEQQSAFVAADIQLRLECPDSVICDSYPETLTKIIGHLLQNVVTHAFPATFRDNRQLEISVECNGDQLLLSCRDNGIGLSPTSLTRVFHPFFTLDMTKGAGIGQPLCKRLALSVLGSDLEVSASAGAGCCFVLSMPMVAPGFRSVPAELAHSSKC
ncbi:MAG: HAMP domain-containing histidine kinase [Rheinheimera sp.]|nr:MAG: HAMP domain-containing histidine kinase [Rheinheimera sp.]